MKGVGSGMLLREDSTNFDKEMRAPMNEEERKRLELQYEIKKLERNQQEFEEMRRKETSYQHIQRLKSEDAEFHRTAFSGLEALDNIESIVAELKLHTGPFNRQLVKPHPSMATAFLEREGAGSGKTLTMDEYLALINE